MLLDTWNQELTSQFQSVWETIVVGILPRLAIAILVFVLGWLVAIILGKWVSQIVKSLQLDRALRGLGAEHVLTRAGFRLDSGAFIGGLIKWFIIIVFLISSLDILGLQEVNSFLNKTVLEYLPRVIAASLILLLAATIAENVQKIIVGSARAVGVNSSHLFGGVAKWAIWISAVLAALSHLNVAGQFAEILFIGIVAMLAIAGGLAFGLGGKESASRYLDHLRQDIANHK